MGKLLLTLSLLILSACGSLSFPGVYQLEIEQGNIVTQEMVDQLKPGMSTRQVRYILGTPLLKDSFHNDRWDYVYITKQGEEVLEQSNLTVFFSEDKLTHIRSDLLPNSAAPETDS